ncbi:MAG: CPBP family intramembrane metalloprotease [Bacteroidaceae bacterium]|nr:CPBP family intramembrane metalloprotease [Bacteroidaceae bacterium]
MKKSIIALAVFIATQIIGTAAATLFTDNLTQTTIWGLMASEVMAFTFLWSTRMFHPSELIGYIPPKILLTSILLIVASVFALNLVNSAMDLPNPMEQQFAEMAKSTPAAISMALLGPIIEEIVFRRVIVSDVMKMSGKPWIAVTVSAALFGLIHINPAQMVFAFMVGLILGWVYIRTGSLLPCLIGHIINNSEALIELRLCNDGSMLPEDGRFYQNPLYLSIFTVCCAASVILAIRLRKQTAVQEPD